MVDFTFLQMRIITILSCKCGVTPIDNTILGLSSTLVDEDGESFHIGNESTSDDSPKVDTNHTDSCTGCY